MVAKDISKVGYDSRLPDHHHPTTDSVFIQWQETLLSAAGDKNMSVNMITYDRQYDTEIVTLGPLFVGCKRLVLY